MARSILVIVFSLCTVCRADDLPEVAGTSSGDGALALVYRAVEIDRLLAKYDNVRHPHQYCKFYRSLFAACEPADVVRLVTHNNDSIATQAAWETVALTVPEEDGPQVYRPDSRRLAWFLGFFEGRNRVVLPEWWRAAVADTRANWRYNTYPGEPNPRPYHQSSSELVTCPSNASVTEEDRGVTYRCGEDSIVLPEELLVRGSRGQLWCNISCAFTREHCFVALHDDTGNANDVACIDRESNRIVWKSEARDCWWGGTTGQHESWVAIVPTADRRVFVFAASFIGFYAHAFDAADGKTLVRFSNNY